MKFAITTTSIKKKNEMHSPKPCDEAFYTPEGWMVNVETIEDLIRLVNKYDALLVNKTDVLSDNGNIVEVFEIEIYEDYREY